MSKKKKNKYTWDLSDFPPYLPKEGELRFFQQKVRGGRFSFWRDDYKVNHDGKKVLQQFTNGEWTDIPFETDTIWVD